MMLKLASSCSPAARLRVSVQLRKAYHASPTVRLRDMARTYFQRYFKLTLTHCQLVLRFI